MKEKKTHERAFDPAKWRKLESPERRERMAPEKLAAALGLAGPETVLDIGVGTGFFAEVIAPMCQRLIGVDRSRDMIDVFRGKDAFGNLSNVELLQGEADDLPVEDASCDVTIHVNLLHEIDDVNRFHDEIKRVLKPGGRMFCADWHAKQTDMGPPLSHRVPAEKAAAMIERDGFKITKQHDIYPDHYVIEASLL